MTKVKMRNGHRLRLLQGGEELFPAMVHALDAAQTQVHLETYMLVFANRALEVVEALERAARRGVEVRLVVDAIGTPQVPAHWQQRLRQAGVQLCIYAPLGRLGLLIPSRWRRLHRKLCVVDGMLGFCGGINLVDDLDDPALGRLPEPRLDFALQVIGPLVEDMHETMEQLWVRMQAVRQVRLRQFRAAWQSLREAWPAWALADEAAATRPQSAALLLRDNVQHRHDIERAYLRAIATARHDIVIANAYFIPGRRLRQALMRAVRRGVRVRLLVQGKYEHFLQYHAARPVHMRLLQAGIDIYEYAPSALHAKVAVIDHRWATVGSTNLDPLSLLLAREANVVSTDRRFATELYQRLDGLMASGGQPLELERLRQRPWHQRWRDGLAFATMRTVLFLTGHRY
jgi:cardiolipin synthase A/B